MAKFLKSIFHTTDRRKGTHYEHEADEEKNDSPQMGTRRQLSISRSGRMRQANKKRHSLTLELYGETIHIDAAEKPTSLEYHVHKPSHTAPAALSEKTTRFDTANTEEILQEHAKTFDVTIEKLRQVAIEKSPEEEIDNAFEIIDKS